MSSHVGIAAGDARLIATRAEFALIVETAQEVWGP
jgi:hypothetical protein